jgi:hypothetical protein
MLHAPTSEAKTETMQSKSLLAPQLQRKLHPHPFGASSIYSIPGATSLASVRPSQAQPSQTPHGLQSPQQLARVPALRPSQSMILQRKCACGGSLELEGECAECKAQREGALQRRVANQGASPVTNAAPPIIHDVLRSPGQPLDAGTRAFMEPRFGHDFSQVRIHTGARAVESARTVNALAYTVAEM